MITLHTTTKQGEKMFSDYFKAKYTSLRQCYNKYSILKQRAEEQCRDIMLQEGGYDFRIISFNTFQFTCGWRNKFGDVRIETANNSYLIIDLPF